MTSKPYEKKKPKEDEVATFYDWMLWRYLGKDNPRGDLAADMQWESDTWPKENTEEAILDYLRYGCGHPACKECIDTFIRCWRSYTMYRQHKIDYIKSKRGIVC